MIVLQSSGNSPAGCGKLAGDTIPGTRSLVTPHPERAQEQYSFFMSCLPAPLRERFYQTNPIQKSNWPCHFVSQNEPGTLIPVHYVHAVHPFRLCFHRLSASVRKGRQELARAGKGSLRKKFRPKLATLVLPALSQTRSRVIKRNHVQSRVVKRCCKKTFPSPQAIIPLKTWDFFQKRPVKNLRFGCASTPHPKKECFICFQCFPYPVRTNL